MTEEEKIKREAVLQFMRASGKKGGITRAQKYTHEELSQMAKDVHARRREKIDRMGI